jgi:hypothetical protein
MELLLATTVIYTYRDAHYTVFILRETISYTATATYTNT